MQVSIHLRGEEFTFEMRTNHLDDPDGVQFGLIKLIAAGDLINIFFNPEHVEDMIEALTVMRDELDTHAYASEDV